MEGEGPKLPPFATIIIHDCRSPSDSDSSPPLMLKPSVTFPAAPYKIKDKDKALPPSWDAKDITSAEGSLELRLLERLAEGRIGTVYPATILAATRGGVDITPTLPQNLCLKFAKKEFCRSLARDAWFYEQLQDLQGVAIAQSYGFYTSTVKEQDIENQGTFEADFVPWQGYRSIPKHDPEVSEWSSSMDWLPDDEKHNPPRYIEPGISDFKSRSPWNAWNLDEGNPIIAVHIMELLGTPCAKIWTQWEKRPDLHQEISPVVDDLSKAGVWHSDLTGFNVLQSDDGCDSDAPGTVRAKPRLCSRHRATHKWRVIDFDRSTIVYLPNTTGSSCLYNDEAMIGRFTVFWGRDSE
ncbi:hypothetical protein BKA70DRAFT_1194650 [Coprinopsis sp. MPI-PUGE-AT-0042]|nr:hypothetical protein BKA70DRAFT_1194650 [Coprinopsis sp. MPI-PUGE-AT-0042]